LDINKDEMVGGLRKLNNEELHNSLPSITRMIKSEDEMAGHVARMEGRKGMHIGFWWESQRK
jgi:hypothetical protein